MTTFPALRAPHATRYDDLFASVPYASTSVAGSSAGLSPKPSPKPSRLGKLKSWKYAVAGRRRSDEGVAVQQQLQVGSGAAAPSNSGHEDARPSERYEWQAESSGEDEAEIEVDTERFSWVDPSIIGSDQFRATPMASRTFSDLGHGVERNAPALPQRPTSSSLPTSPTVQQQQQPKRPRLNLNDSYNLLLSYQSAPLSDCSGSQQNHQTPQSPTGAPSSSNHDSLANSEWHELVDDDVIESLGRQEVRRQGLWWELIKGEREYVRDLKTITDVFIQPLRLHQPPLLAPETRLEAFIAEVFSSVQAICRAHVRLVDRLMERQRWEWPLITSATDILLGTFLESVDLYEQYMKNYPFAEARVRREQEKNPEFRTFLQERNTIDLTKRRDISVFLSRPVTRLPRVLLLLEALLGATPPDHPDQEALPTVITVLTRVLKGSQPGIEAAESKIKLWNVAEKLLFKKGEIIELDIGEPKRTLVHSGYVFRRVRSETNWHGWQDLHAFLLDNYFLMTRDEEHGKHVVVSRPIPLDYLELHSADGAPERRHDFISQYRRRSGNEQSAATYPERLMYPFTISTGPGGRTYTLCTATETAREQWKEMILNIKRLRQFDLESNHLFAVHQLSIPPEIRDPVSSAETFTWLGREAIAVATSRSVWIGWRRDTHSYRELLRFNTGSVSALTIIPDFSWLLVLISGRLCAYNLRDMLPTSEPLTWMMMGAMQGHTLSAPEHSVAFVRIGVTKSRLLVVYAAHSKSAHQTVLSFHEPLVSYDQVPTESFRQYATLTLPGYASEISFFRQTMAVVTEKSFIIAEPGNPQHNIIPTFPTTVAQNATVVRMVASAKPMAMYQVAENEFLLVYDWGACFVTKYGEVAKNGVYLRWNLTPTYCVFRSPHLLLFDDTMGRAEIRDVTSGRMCEVVEEKGMRALRLARSDQAMLALSSKGLLQLVETVAL